ncbi:carbohydrate ABC transporter permease [Gracilinema caldarium]|uniref:ABC-type transporter, integral membrane subunit n=1 Tax=Gracilinema caldarium (strain ATCC 51460 / DSM 7334 / H1) TaxID=744872 RepID=F8F0B8_GRAC1|nr:sugar ABC transporter permease [Gracilinema caldarium]AEJ18982.1 ABC-type transporter, integral membrane subunit [Gracilinema caldarium DSM 7334]
MHINYFLIAVLAIAIIPLIIWAYLLVTEMVVSRAPRRVSRNLRPWLWLLPALSLLFVFLVYPALHTVALSFLDAKSANFVGLANYIYIFTDPNMLIVLRNNVLWLVLFTLFCLFFGLLIALLADRVRYESVAKAFVFLPMAISFVAAGVIWKFMYEYRPAGSPQIGTVNAFLTTINPSFEPKAWLFDRSTNNIALIVVGIWMWTGFAMVILSAGLKGISEDLLEAARIDGADEFIIFFKIILPLLVPTITVVATTLIINVLKVFDIVYVMTNGNLGTEVIANRMYKEMFNYRNYGRASAIATLLLLAIIPVMVMNIKRFNAEGSHE